MEGFPQEGVSIPLLVAAENNVLADVGGVAVGQSHGIYGSGVPAFQISASQLIFDLVEYDSSFRNEAELEFIR